MDGRAGSGDEFHETLEDITSASSSDAEESGKRSGTMRARVARVAPATSHERPPVWTPSSFHSKFSVWKDDPSSVNDRRQRFFQNWGIKNLREEPNVGRATSLVSKGLLGAGAAKDAQLVAEVSQGVASTTADDVSVVSLLQSSPICRFFSSTIELLASSMFRVYLCLCCVLLRSSICSIPEKERHAGCASLNSDL